MHGDSLIHEATPSERVIAITFDSGLNPIYAPQLIEIFSKVDEPYFL